MTRERVRDAGLTGREAQFAAHELFMSRTDQRGVIRSGNSIFQRIAGFTWDTLIGAPHRLIRHPATPKGVFHIFWERLSAGKPVGAYVLNRTAEGDQYWVFAVAFPSPDGDGYVSVRLKPLSELRDRLSARYRALVAEERNGGLSPADSAAALLAWLRDEGFGSYGDFMAKALSEEFAARETELERFPDPQVARARRMAETIGSARAHAGSIATLFNGIRNVPTNIRILASQLEQDAGPVSVISTNHNALSAEMVTGVEAFRQSTQETFALINRGLFFSCAAAILAEMEQLFARDTGLPASIDTAAEARILRAQGAILGREQADALADVAAQARRFAEVTEGLKRHVAGLDVTRIMCKIENARFREKRTGLTEIIDNLETVQGAISEELSALERASHLILSSARKAALTV